MSTNGKSVHSSPSGVCDPQRLMGFRLLDGSRMAVLQAKRGDKRVCVLSSVLPTSLNVNTIR